MDWRLREVAIETAAWLPIHITTLIRSPVHGQRMTPHDSREGLAKTSRRLCVDHSTIASDFEDSVSLFN